MKTYLTSLAGLFAAFVVAGSLCAAEPATPAAPSAPEPPDTVMMTNKDGSAKPPVTNAAQSVKGQTRTHDAKEIVIPIFALSLPVLIVFTVTYFRHRRERILHETLRTMIEKGVSIPPGLLQPQEPRKQPRSDFRNGVICVAAGIGLTIFLLVRHDQMWPLGLILLLIGGAFLITWKVEGSKNNSNPS